MATTPTNLVIAIGNGQLVLTWSAVSGATSYKVYRSSTAGSQGTLIATISNPTYNDTGLTNGTTYYYEVTAVDSSGESTPTPQISGIPQYIATNYAFGLKGFFFEEGSPDFPQNFSPEKQFGFNPSTTGLLTPVFESSLMDVEYAFTDLREFSQPSQDPTTPSRTDQLILEATGTDAPKILGTASILSPYTFSGSGEDPAWNALFLILEYLYSNQSTIGQATTGGSAYKNTADTYLSTTTAVNKYYKSGSIAITNSTAPTKIGRVSNISFTLIMTNGDTIPIQIYFDPDDYIENSVQSYEVYCFNYSSTTQPTVAQFITPSSVISNNTINQNIISEIFNIMKTSKANIYTTYDTPAYPIDPTTGIRVSTPITMRFYVFARVPEGEANSYQWNNDIIISQIKLYIIQNVIPDAGNPTAADANRVATFPSLFTTQTVSIYPFYANTIPAGTSGNQSITVNPVNMTAMMQFFISIAPGNLFQNVVNNIDVPVELFYVGQDATGTLYRYPLFAIETDSNGYTDRPISSRFNNYVPIDAQNPPDLTQNNDSAVIFHFILALALKLIDGSFNISSLPPNVATFMNSSSLGLNMSYTPATPTSRDFVVFEYQTVVWTVYGYGRQA